MSSTQHTQGRLDLDSIDPRILRDLATGSAIAMALANDDDARRLLACWNHAIAIETNALDGGGVAPLATLLAGVDVQQELLETWQARTQRLVDALAKTETYLQERVGSNPGSRGATVILPMIRRAIEGAGVAPTQTSWGDCPGPEV